MLLPADTYVVINKSIVTDVDKKIVVDLYQPIIGNTAVSLYNTFLNDLGNDFMTDMYTNHHLLTTMKISLELILEAREKLEAVGLLKTFYKKDSINSFIYYLYSPVSANEFLNHPILNVVLYNNVGKKEYERIVQRYKLPRISIKDYDDITTSFDKVFSSVPTTSFFQNEELINRSNKNIEFSDTIDFEYLIAGLNNIVSEKLFTKEIKYLITNLCFIYNIDVMTMQNLIKSSLTEKGTIDKELLRKSARSYYQFENSGNLPNLAYIKQPEYLKSPVGGTSLKAKMIYTFENTNPYNYLKSKYKDGKVIGRDLALIEDLIVDLKLTPGVVNVLLDYVMRVNNKKLSKNYVLTIGSNWKRLGIETVPDAMNACLKEYKKQNKKNVNKSTKEIVPEWFDSIVSKKEVTDDEEKQIKELLGKYN